MWLKSIHLGVTDGDHRGLLRSACESMGEVTEQAGLTWASSRAQWTIMSKAKVLAFNSSPHGSDGATAFILGPFLDGMRAAGAEVELLYPHKMDVRSCLGCLNCWTKTPGRCIQSDDMTRELLPSIHASDLIVYATPLYYNTMNAAMGIFRERMLPLSLPFVEKRDGKRFFQLRHKMPSTVWLSVCALPEMSEFDALSNFLHATHHPDMPIVAEIYRTSSEALRHAVFENTRGDILQATTQAGGELVRSMKISPDTMARIIQPLMDPDSLAIIGNLAFQTCIAENLTLKEFFEKEITPRPNSLKAFMAYSVLGFNANAAEGKKIILQFSFTEEMEDSCYFTFEQGNIKANIGTSNTYDIAIKTPFELWMDIMTGKVEGREMFMQGKYQVEGDLSLMLALFNRRGHR